jgi:hypothetical protein
VPDYRRPKVYTVDSGDTKLGQYDPLPPDSGDGPMRGGSRTEHYGVPVGSNPGKHYVK